MFEIDVDALTTASRMSREVLVLWGKFVADGIGYERISVPQKRRRPRDVLRPSVGLDRVLKQLGYGLVQTSGYVAPDAVHGFVKRRSIVTNASQHLGKDVVLKVDIKDFFDSVNADKILSSLSGLGFTGGCAEMVASVALVDGKLAQGFSTSPLISNMALLSTDEAMVELAHRNQLTYTRYVDDLTFSGHADAIQDEFLEVLQARLAEFKWKVNPAKTRFMRRGGPQFVTGLYVGDVAGPHIPRPMKRRLRREMYFAEKFGLANARQRSPMPMSMERLAGWVHYSAHADPAFGRPLRSRWYEVAPSLDEGHPGPDWGLLREIDFPADL